MNTEISQQITIVTACRNREDNLRQAIQSWIALSPYKILVCDWGSTIPLSYKNLGIEEYKHTVDILRREADQWILTWAFNEALMQVKSTYTLKLDCDHVISNTFLESNQPCIGHFSRGHWRHAEEGQQYINGAFMSCSDLLRRVGYYDERITTYGWDDSDLYERLFDASLGSSVFTRDSISHLEQCETTRTKEQEVSKESALASHLGLDKTAFLISRNRIFCGMVWPWDSNSFNRREEIRTRFLTNQPELDILIEYATYKAFEKYYQDKGYHSKTGVPAGNAYEELIFSLNLSSSNLPSTLNLAQLLKRFSDAYRKQDAPEMSLVRGYLLATTLDARLQSRLKAIDGIVQVHQKYKSISGSESGTETKNNRSTNFNINKRKLYIDAQHGLGNRLRSIGSAAAIASGMDRELVIIWSPDEHCECYFTDLFTYSGPIISESFYGKIEECTFFNYMEAEGGTKNAALKCASDQDIYVRSAFVLNSPYSQWSRENEFIQSLEPVEEVKSMIASVRNPNDLSVHIRMEGGIKDERLPYESPNNWSEADHKAINYWRSQSHYSLFMAYLDNLLSKEGPKTFFLAADKPEIYKFFAAKYLDKVSWLDRNVYDRSMMQLRFALADAILLSRSSLLLGSTWSSFSELAQRLAVGSLSVKMSGKDF